MDLRSLIYRSSWLVAGVEEECAPEGCDQRNGQDGAVIFGRFLLPIPVFIDVRGIKCFLFVRNRCRLWRDGSKMCKGMNFECSNFHRVYFYFIQYVDFCRTKCCWPRRRTNQRRRPRRLQSTTTQKHQEDPARDKHSSVPLNACCFSMCINIAHGLLQPTTAPCIHIQPQYNTLL